MGQLLGASVTMVCERASDTLERLLTTASRRGELIRGHTLAFLVAAWAQALVSSAVAARWLGLAVSWSVVCGLHAITRLASSSGCLNRMRLTGATDGLSAMWRDLSIVMGCAVVSITGASLHL